MKIRLILFVIAMIVVALIIWDHKKKNKKANKYLPKPYKKYLPDSLTSSLGEMFVNKKSNQFPGQPKQSSLLRSSQAPSDFIDEVVDDYDFDRDYKLSKEFDEFDLIVHEKDEYSEYKAKAYSSAPPKDFSDTRTSERSYIKKSTTASKANYSKTSKPETNNSMYRDEQPMFLVSLHIKALNHRRLGGDELLQALVSSGCRYGEMSVFHRHEKTSGHGGIMFSIASMVKPGTFDIDNMHEFSTPGITLFFSTQGQFNPLLVYDLLLKTAYKLAKLLDAEILDDAREPLTNAKITETKHILENYVSATESNY